MLLFIYSLPQLLQSDILSFSNKFPVCEHVCSHKMNLVGCYTNMLSESGRLDPIRWIPNKTCFDISSCCRRKMSTGGLVCELFVYISILLLVFGLLTAKEQQKVFENPSYFHSLLKNKDDRFLLE